MLPYLDLIVDFEVGSFLFYLVNFKKYGKIEIYEENYILQFSKYKVFYTKIGYE